MASTLLTPTKILMESQRILHQKANFIMSTTRSYDEEFGRRGAKVGNSIQIRKPNEYTVRTGRAINVQDQDEESVTLTVSTQKGVDMYFTSAELTMDIDRFSERYIEPAVTRLVSNIESDYITNIYKDIYQQADNVGAALTMAKLLLAKKRLTDALCPSDGRNLSMNTQASADIVDALKGLFQDSTQIAKQYREGMLGQTAGFGQIFENTHWPEHTSGTENGASTTLVVNGADQTGSSVTVTNGSSKTLKAGDIVTFAGCNRVHPESKADTGALMQFVVTADVATNGTSISISPSIVVSGAKQNVSASPTDTGAVTKVGGASAVYDISMAYHKEAFAFATADLEMPDGVDMAARKTVDGISMRLVRQYDVRDDTFPMRLDILYGYKTIRPELACRLANN